MGGEAAGRGRTRQKRNSVRHKVNYAAFNLNIPGAGSDGDCHSDSETPFIIFH